MSPLHSAMMIDEALFFAFWWVDGRWVVETFSILNVVKCINRSYLCYIYSSTSIAMNCNTKVTHVYSSCTLKIFIMDGYTVKKPHNSCFSENVSERVGTFLINSH